MKKWIVLFILISLSVFYFNVGFFKNVEVMFFSLFKNNQPIYYSDDVLVNEINVLKKENELLKKEMNLDVDNYYICFANVIVRDDWFNYVLIDKGLSDGIKEGSGVINEKGFVGVIKNVYSDSALVSLLSGKKIAVLINTNYGVIEYNKNNSFIASGIDGIADINIDDSVVTTNFSSLIPSNLLIGKVKNVTYDEYGLSKIVDVSSSVDFNDLNVVGVILK